MDKKVSLYIDVPFGYRDIKVDDFVVTIGKKGHTNSVYHVAEVKIKRKTKIIRYYVKCYRSDLMTACARDKENQNIIDIVWYDRNKK